MLRSSLYPLSVALLLAACTLGSGNDDDDDDKDNGGGGSSDAWYGDFVDTYCSRVVECYDEATLEAMGYEDEGDCKDAMEEAAEDAEDTGEECSFDADAGAQCLDSMAEGDCDDFVAAGWAEDCAADDLCE